MATGFIESIKSGLSSFLHPKESSSVVTGIDIGASSIKLVELSLRNGRIVLNTYGSIALGPYANAPIGSVVSASSEQISKAIEELFKECKASQSRVAVSLPTSASLFRDIAIPSGITDTEVQTVVMTEAHRVIPVPVQDVDIDWLTIPHDILPKEEIDPTKKHFLLVAVSHESQKRVAGYMEGAHIEPALYELEVFSSMRSVYTHERAPIVLIDLGAAHIKVSVIHEGVMRRAAALDRGFNELENALMVSGITFEAARKQKHTSSITGLTDEEKTFRTTYTSILKDVQSVITEYERYSHSSIARAVLLGGGAEMNDITAFTESILGIPTEKSHPFERAIIPTLVADIITSIEPEFTVATGVALRLLANS